MKLSLFRYFALAMMILASHVSLMAQDDDMYFTPGKVQPKQRTVTQIRTEQSRDYIPTYGSQRNVDEYNRRGSTTDKQYRDDNYVAPDTPQYYYDDQASGYGAEDYYYAGRIARFYTPDVFIAVGAPYRGVLYNDYYYSSLSDPFYPYYTRWGYRRGWYTPWGYSGYYAPYYSGYYPGYYNPWYTGYYGWGGGYYGYAYPYIGYRQYYPSGGGRYTTNARSNRSYRSAPYGGYNYYGGSNNRSTINRSYTNGNNSRTRVNVSSRTYQGNTPSRSYSTPQSSRQLPTRSQSGTYGNNSYSAPTRSYSAPPARSAGSVSRGTIQGGRSYSGSARGGRR